MLGNKNFKEYQATLDKVIQYAITHDIQYSCDGRSETYYIKNKLVVTARPPFSKPDKTWPWKIAPKTDQPIFYEARLDGKEIDEKLAPQWIFNFLAEQCRLQARRIAIVSAKALARASA